MGSDQTTNAKTPMEGGEKKGLLDTSIIAQNKRHSLSKGLSGQLQFPVRCKEERWAPNTPVSGGKGASTNSVKHLPVPSILNKCNTNTKDTKQAFSVLPGDPRYSTNLSMLNQHTNSTNQQEKYRLELSPEGLLGFSAVAGLISEKCAVIR